MNAAPGSRGEPGRRLLYVINEAYFFVSHRLPVARAAQAAGFEVHVAAPEDHVWAPAGFSTDAFRDLGIQFHPLPMSRRGTNPLRDAATFLAVFRLLRRVRPTIAHFITIKPNIYGGAAARLAGVPGVVFAVTGLGHAFVARGVKASLLRWCVKAMMRVSMRQKRGRVIFQNPDDLRQLIDSGIVEASRSVVILGSGVDLTRFVMQPEAPGTPVVVLCARLIWEKGVREFVEAARTLRSEGVAGRFALVGDTQASNPRAVPRATIEGWVREGLVEWWGYRADMDQVFGQAHVVCLPSSYGEGVPKVLLEAAASGRAVVTTDIPGCRETVQHGKSGFLVRPGDPLDLVNRLRELLRNPSRRAEFGQAARRLAEAAFDDRSIGRETLRVYQELEGGALSGGPVRARV